MNNLFPETINTLNITLFTQLRLQKKFERHFEFLILPGCYAQQIYVFTNYYVKIRPKYTYRLADEGENGKKRKKGGWRKLERREKERKRESERASDDETSTQAKPEEENRTLLHAVISQSVDFRMCCTIE